MHEARALSAQHWLGCINWFVSHAHTVVTHIEWYRACLCFTTGAGIPVVVNCTTGQYRDIIIALFIYSHMYIGQYHIYRPACMALPLIYRIAGNFRWCKFSHNSSLVLQNKISYF